MTSRVRAILWIASTCVGNLVAWLLLAGVLHARLYVIGDCAVVVGIMAAIQAALLGARVKRSMWVASSVAGNTLMYLVAGLGVVGGPLVSFPLAGVVGWVQGRLWRIAWGRKDAVIQRCSRNVIVAHALAVAAMWTFVFLALPALRKIEELVPRDAPVLVFALADALLVALGTVVVVRANNSDEGPRAATRHI